MNDVARSVIISAIKGTRLWFYKNANIDLPGGFCEVYVKESVSAYVLDSFKRNYDDSYISVRYWNSQDLDGEISCFQTSYEGPWIPNP